MQAGPSTSYFDNTIDLPWQNFQNLEFVTKFQREVLLFLEILEFRHNAGCRIGGKKPPCQNQLDFVYSFRYNTGL